MPMLLLLLAVAKTTFAIQHSSANETTTALSAATAMTVIRHAIRRLERLFRYHRCHGLAPFGL